MSSSCRRRCSCPAYWVLPSVLIESISWSISAAIVGAVADAPFVSVRALDDQVARPLQRVAMSPSAVSADAQPRRGVVDVRLVLRFEARSARSGSAWLVPNGSSDGSGSACPTRARCS